jgi:hypothetical protein
MPTQPTHLALQTVADALLRLRAAEMGAHAFGALCRDQLLQLQEALPARYSEVLLGLLDRLEAGSLFSEESCSFSQTDLHDSLQMWVDKAHGVLTSTNAP